MITINEEHLRQRQKNICPNCGSGIHGVDSLCDDCYSEYLGTHYGSLNDESEVDKLYRRRESIYGDY